MNKILAGMFFSLLFTFGAFGEMLYPEPGTPIFAVPEPGAKIISFAGGNSEYSVITVQRYMLRMHPFGRYFDFNKVKLANGQSGWICKELRLIDNNGKKELDRIPPDNSNYIISGVACSLLLLVIAFYFIGGKWFPTHMLQFGLRKMSAREQTIGLLALLVLARYLQLFIMLAGNSNLVTLSPDGNTYFSMARDIVSLNFNHPWDRSVGTCFIYIPFALLYPEAKSFLDVAPQLSAFNGFVVMPLCFILGFFIIRKVCGSELKAFFAVLLWIIIPFFYFIVHDLSSQTFAGIIRLPYLGYGWNMYCIHQAFSFNNLIDAFSTFCVFLTVFMALYLPAKWWMAALVSALFGLTCLVRLNNIFFAPLIAFLFWFKLNCQWNTWRQILSYATGCVLCFMLIFSIQIVFNKIHVGSIYKFPYALINADTGFKLKDLSYSTNYLIRCNYLFFVLGIWGMIYCKDKYCRNFLILLAAPTAIFFCGCSNTTTDPIRYILSIYLPLTAAFVCAAPWRELDRRKVACLAVIPAVIVFFYQPLCFKWIVLPSAIPGDYIGGLIAFACCLGIIFYFFRDRKFALYAGVFLLLYCLNSHWLLLAALVILTAVAVIDFILHEVLPGLRQIIK